MITFQIFEQKLELVEASIGDLKTMGRDLVDNGFLSDSAEVHKRVCNVL